MAGSAACGACRPGTAKKRDLRSEMDIMVATWSLDLPHGHAAAARGPATRDRIRDRARCLHANTEHASLVGFARQSNVYANVTSHHGIALDIALDSQPLRYDT